MASRQNDQELVASLASSWPDNVGALAHASSKRLPSEQGLW